MEQRENKQQRGVTLGQALGALITIAGACILFYTQTQERITALEYRMSEKEKVDIDYHDQFEKISTKLDHMQLELFDIKVEVMKKADKKE